MSADNANEEVEIDLGTFSDEELAEFEAVLVADYEDKRGVQELGVEELSELEALKAALIDVRAEMTGRTELAESDEVVAQVARHGVLHEIAAHVRDACPFRRSLQYLQQI